MSELRALVRTMQAMSAGVSVELRNLVVYSVAPGASTDGLDQVTVTLDGAQVTAPYLTDAYPAAAVSDVVACLVVDRSPLILGRVGGFPTH